MKYPRLSLSRSSQLAAAIVSLLAAASAQAVDIYWNGTDTGWDVVANWSTVSGAETPNPIAIPTDTDIVNFSISSISNTPQTINLNANQSALRLNFLGSNTSTTTLLGGGTAYTLTLGDVYGAPPDANGIMVSTGAGAVTIGSTTAGDNVFLTLVNDQAWTNNSTAGTLTIQNDVDNSLDFLLTVDGVGNSVINGVITGGALTKSGGGTLTLNVANAYTGLTKVEGGTLAYGITNALSTGAVTVTGQYSVLALNNKNDTVALVTVKDGASITGTGTLTTQGTGGGFEFESGSVSANLTGIAARKINKTTSGFMLLSGSNTYLGVTTLSGGILSVGSIGNGGVTGNFGKATNAAGNIVFNNGTLQYTGATGSTDRNFTITDLQGAYFDIFLSGTNLTWSGASISTGGTLTKTGVGTLTLSGLNLHTGLTKVTDGTLAYGRNSALSTGGVTVEGSSAVLSMGAYTDIVGTVTLAGGSITGTGTSGVLTASTGNTFEMQSGSVSAVLGGASIPLNKTTAGMVTLSNTNTYTGLTTVSEGTLAYGISDAISTGPVTVSGGTLALGSYIDNVGTVTLASGSITGTGTSGILTASTGNTFEMQSGSVSAVLDGASIPLNKTTAGMVTLSNTNTYTGLTTVSAGTLAYGISDAISTGAITVSGGTLALGSYVDSVGTVTLASGSITGTGTSGILTASTGNTFEMQGGSVTAVLDGTSIPLNKTTAGMVTLSNTNTYTGLTTVSAGTLAYGINDAILTGAVTVSGGTFALGSYTDSVGTVTLTSGSITGSGTLTSTGTFAMESGSASAVLAGSSIPLNKTTTGTASLSNANTYSGNTTIIAGTLTLGASGSFNNSPIITVGTTGSVDTVLDVTAKIAGGGFTILNGQTLKGIGTVDANDGGTLGKVVISGTHAPGNSVGIETIDGNVQYTGANSLFVWELNTGAMGTRGSLGGAGGYDGVNVSGTVTGTSPTADAIFKVVLLAGSYGDGFWSANRQWNSIFTGVDGITAKANWTSAFGSIEWYAGATPATGDHLTPPGYFSFTPATGTATGNTLYWTAVPEPTGALAGLLVGAGLLRRRRGRKVEI